MADTQSTGSQEEEGLFCCTFLSVISYIEIKKEMYASTKATTSERRNLLNQIKNIQSQRVFTATAVHGNIRQNSLCDL